MRYFIFKTDHHIVEPGHRLDGVDTATQAKAAVAKVLAEQVPIEWIIDAGDVGDTVSTPNRGEAEGSVETYEHALSILAPINDKTLYIPGNHDYPSRMYDVLGDRWDSNQNGVMVKELSGLTLIGIDLRIDSWAVGTMRPETAQELSKLLPRCKRCMIFSHYLWRPTDNSFIQKAAHVNNAEEVGAILGKHRDKIIAAFHGHLHSWWTGTYCGIPIYGCAGSAMGFIIEPGPDPIVITKKSPLGYYLIGVNDDGSVLVRPRYIETVNA